MNMVCYKHGLLWTGIYSSSQLGMKQISDDTQNQFLYAVYDHGERNW